MRGKWLLIACSLLVAIVLAGCAKVVRPVTPFLYDFEVGQTNRYTFRLETQLLLEAGLIGYQGEIALTGSLYVMPVEFTAGRYKMRLLIKNVALNNADRAISGGIYGYINYLSTVFYEWHMTPDGVITVYHRNVPVYPLAWLANMVLVDVSRWGALSGGGDERATNFPAKFQEQRITVDTTLFQRLVNVEDGAYTVEQRYTYSAYQEKGFPLASVEMQMETLLNRGTRRLQKKTGNFQFHGRVPFLRQGIFTLSASFQGMGRITLEEVAQP